MLFAAIFVLSGASASVIAADSAEFAPNLKPTGLPAIRSIVIQNGGMGSRGANDTDPPCRAFVLSKAEVREYLRKAGEVTAGEAHVLDWSPCYTTGRVTFMNGKRGTWRIEQLRAGSLEIDGGETIQLYCLSCKGKAYPTEPESQ